jgi:hypothetical protein
MGRVTVEKPHCQRDTAESPFLKENHRGPLERSKTQGVLGLHAGPHMVLATEDPGGSRAADHPGPSHTAPAPRLVTDGRTRIWCAGRVTTTQACHMGCSWLIAACVAATSARIAGLQPSNRQL